MDKLKQIAHSILRKRELIIWTSWIIFTFFVYFKIYIFIDDTFVCKPEKKHQFKLRVGTKLHFTENLIVANNFEPSFVAFPEYAHLFDLSTISSFAEELNSSTPPFRYTSLKADTEFEVSDCRNTFTGSYLILKSPKNELYAINDRRFTRTKFKIISTPK